MSFKTEIEAIVGDIDSPDYTTQAQLYLTEGLNFIIKTISTNRLVAQKLTSNAILNNSSTTLDTSNILSIVAVERGDGTRNRKAKEVAFEDFADYSDANSIYYTNKFDPVYAVMNDTLYVTPTPTASENAVIRKIEASSISLGGTSVSNFPNEYERGVVLYASRELLRYIMNQIRKPNVANGTTLTADMAAGAIGTDADKRDYDKYFDISMDFIADEDVELAQTMMGQIQTYLQNYQVDLTADTQQYQWYESQYVKVTQDLLSFLTTYITVGGQNEVATDG